MVSGLVIALHLIEMVRDAVDFFRRILDRQDRAICRFGRFVCGSLRLCRGLFGMSCRGLRLGRGGFSLLGLLLVVRGASRDRNSEHENR